MTDKEWKDLQKRTKAAKEALGGDDFDPAVLEGLKDEFERVSNLESTMPPSDEAIKKASALFEALLLQLMKSGDENEFTKAELLARNKNFTLKVLARHYETELRADA
ncbi:MAG: hypothetical protein Q4F45_07935 [Alistipes sp.]|nr:hypothetical protein [Alistipes sp.]